MPDLTDYAEDQLRRLREFVSTPAMTLAGTPVFSTLEGTMCVTASARERAGLPPIWAELEESGHVTVIWADPFTAYVKPAS